MFAGTVTSPVVVLNVGTAAPAVYGVAAVVTDIVVLVINAGLLFNVSVPLPLLFNTFPAG